MHLLNKSETIKRRLEKYWTLSDSLKMREYQQELSESIGLDMSLLIEKRNLTSWKDSFKLLRTLEETSAFPLVINYDGVTFQQRIKRRMHSMLFSALSIVVKFTRMFQHLKSNLDSSIKLQDVTFGVLEIENILSKCDDSSSMGSDQVPSFLLRDGMSNFSTSSYVIISSYSKVLALA